jgi:hypothetical protein
MPLVILGVYLWAFYCNNSGHGGHGGNNGSAAVCRWFADHALVQVFTVWTNPSSSARFTAIIMCLLYCFTWYQNGVLLRTLYRNLGQVYDTITQLGQFVSATLTTMRQHLNWTAPLKTYTLFHEQLDERIRQLELIETKLSQHPPRRHCIGPSLALLYELSVTNLSAKSTIEYAIEFQSYHHHLQLLATHRPLTNATFVLEHASRFNMVDMVPSVSKTGPFDNAVTNNAVTNSARLKPLMIITGPNASGKTTFMKNVMFQLLLTQQFGMGMYRSCHVCPYTHFHCYANIADTNGPDSLFQAEVRRVAEIFAQIRVQTTDNNTINNTITKDQTETNNTITKDPTNTITNARHFCIMDEPFRGTNGDDMAKCLSKLFKECLHANNRNVVMHTMITTHQTEPILDLPTNDRRIIRYCTNCSNNCYDKCSGHCGNKCNGSNNCSNNPMRVGQGIDRTVGRGVEILAHIFRQG